MADSTVGKPLPRLEDQELLTGSARFVDDLNPDGLLHAAFVRSAFGHARINNVDTDAARDMPGVVAVYTIDDLGDVLTQDRVPETHPKPPPRVEIGPWVLARDEVCYVGEPIAVVIAEDRYQAEDAAAMVMVDYDPLDSVTDCRASAEAGAPRVDTRNKGNIFQETRLGYGDCDAAFARADHVVSETLYQHRGVAMSMECRGVVASWNERRRKFNMWASTQGPHGHKAILVHLFGLMEDQVRVVVPHVGGGFGPKLNFYPEDAAVSAATLKLARPIKWIEDRREHLIATTQERDQVWDVEIAADSEGKILGLRGMLFHDQGAYTVRGTNIPFSASTTILGPYIVPNYRMDIVIAHTNKVPATSMRGAGHPQGNFTMEKMLDRLADKMGLDPAEIRRRNMIAADQIPYEQKIKTQAGQPVIYDSGDYPKCQADLLEALDYDGFAERQRVARAAGRHLGIGISNYVKPTGRGPFENGLVRIGTSGKASVYTGAVAMGQGFKTAMAQLCAEQLGIDPKDVIVVAGDTDGVANGIGGFASRQTVCAGSAIHMASVAVRKKILSVAAHLLEASEDDLELVDGRVSVAGVPEMSVGFKDIANAVAGTPGVALPDGVSAGLEAEISFKPENVTYANGAHGCEVEVDPETGEIKITRYVVIHDSGRLINPLIVDGQVHGGVTLGVGHALFEHMRYDGEGQPLSTNLAEYLIPTAPELPNFEVVHQVSPTDRNPIGVKGVGECGVMSATPALHAAIENALSEYDVRLDRYPVTPSMIAEKVLASGQA